MSSTTNAFPQATVLAVAYGMLAVTTAVLFVRLALNIRIPKRLAPSDYLLFAGYVCFVTMCALYIAVSPYMIRVYGVGNGERPPYPDLPKDARVLINMVFSAFMLFWMTLWCIKFSFLFLYRVLLVGISRAYTIVWWVIFCTHVGNYLLFFRSCGGGLKNLFSGECAGVEAKDAQLTSLYYSLAVDVTTNLMIMALPIWLTWNLQIERSKKIAILSLFGSGFVCILFACIRVGQIAVNASKEAAGQPLDPTWLAIWGMVECAVAVIIGCCPGFAVLINVSRAKSMYSSKGYRRHGETPIEREGASRVELSTVRNGGGKKWRRESEADMTNRFWTNPHESEEELRKPSDRIMVSTVVTQESTLVDTDHDGEPSRKSTAGARVLD